MTITSPAHQQTLAYLKDKLAKEGFQAHLIAGGSQAPYDALLVLAEDTQDDSREWKIEISFMPLLEDKMEGVSILQCFAPIAVGRAEGQAVLDNLLWTINRINTRLPLTGFGFLEPEATLYFKHNAMLHDTAPDRNFQVVSEIIEMITFQLNNFGYILFKVANGQQTGSQALQDSPFRELYL